MIGVVLLNLKLTIANLNFFSRAHDLCSSRKGGSGKPFECLRGAGIPSHEAAALGTQAKADEAASFCPPLTSWAHQPSHTPDHTHPSHALAICNCTTASCACGLLCDVR